MKTFRNILNIGLGLAICVASLQGCKKGDNDPGFSLKTRKGRLAGEWKLTKVEETSTNGGVTSTTTYDGTTMSDNNGGLVTTYTYSRRVTFEKDGTFKLEETTGSSASTMTGYWYFIGKNKGEGLKNKEAVGLTITNSTSSGTTSTYTGFSTDFIIMIDRLSNKEMVVVDDQTTTAVGGGSTYKSTETYEKN